MPEGPGKRRSNKVPKRLIKEPGAKKRAGTRSSGRLESVPTHLQAESQPFVHNLLKERPEVKKENKRLRLKQMDLQAAYKYSRSLLDAAAVGLLALSRKGTVLESNFSAAEILGRDPSNLTGLQFEECLYPEDVDVYASHVKRLWSKGVAQTCELRLMGRGDDVHIPVRLHSVLSDGCNSGSIHLITITGIAEQRESDLKQDLATNVLPVLNRGSGDMQVLIREVLRRINKSIGFDAIGLRLRQGEDYPYFEQSGFTNEFLYTENFLCSKNEDGAVARNPDGQPILECTCGLVLSGQTESSSPFFTEGGSFWINNATELLSLPEDSDPRKNPRNQCIHKGFQSVALIPVHSGREIIGLLQLNDHRRNRLSQGLVHFFEGLGDHIGLTLQRKQVEEALRQNQLDLNRAQAVGQIGSWRLDVERNVLTWSDENHRIFGIPKGTPMTYESFLSAVHEEDRQYVDSMWKAALQGEPYDIEHRILVNGKVKWIREKAYLEFNNKGELFGGFGISQDITNRKEAEEELKVLNESLERRVAERSVLAEYRAEQLQKLTLDLTLFEQRERQRLAMVLHDGLQQILVGAKIQLSFVERSRDIHQSIEQVSELIDDAIDTSRSLTAELSPPILLQGDLVLAFEWLVRWMHRKYGLNVRLIGRKKIKPLPEEINLLLFQALRELLFNVVKHAGVKEATVRISERNGRIETIVEDKGQGFDPAELRAEGGQSEGIGLFGIRERLTYFGGGMEVESTPGKGSCFKMNLPRTIILNERRNAGKRQLQEGSDDDSRSQSIAPSERHRIRILLADDHIVMRQGLSRLLGGEHDMDVVGEASDGESAIGLTRELSPDVVLMDINMPGIGGIEAARVIHKEYPGICIIGLSMFQESERADAMRTAGAEGYIDKSGPADSVVATIRNCIKGREKRRG